MANQDLNLEFNTFVGGILTEANPINYPAGYTLDEENFILERNGTRRRRRGLKLETVPGSPFRFIDYWRDVDDTFKDIYLWKSGAGDNDVLCMVYKTRVEYYLLDDNKDVASKYMGSTAISRGIVCVTSHNGFLLINEVPTGDTQTFDYLGPTATHISRVHVVSVKAPNTVTYYGIGDLDNQLQYRDTEGLSPSSIEERGGSLNATQAYDLVNTGWMYSGQITTFFTNHAEYPSIFDNVNVGIDNTGAFNSSWIYNNNIFNTRTNQQPKGKILVNITDPNTYRRVAVRRSGYPNTTGMNVGFSYSVISDMISFGGRVFYLVKSADQYGTPLSRIMFSQVSTNREDFFKCYQINDPTSSITSDVLDTDGGVIDITNSGQPLKLVEVRGRLIIFTTTGIYELSSSSVLITPATLSVRKISNIVPSHEIREFQPVSSTYSRGICNHPVVANDTVFFLATGDVYALTFAADSSEYVLKSVTDNTIHKLVSSIPETKKPYVRGVFVEGDNTVRFLYNSTEANSDTSVTFDNRYTFDSELVLDLPLNAWYKNTFGVDGESIIIGAIYSQSMAGTFDYDYPVEDNLLYLVSSSDSAGASYKLCFAHYGDDTFTDFADNTTGGVNVPAFMQTGYINGGDSQRYKQASYIIPSFLRTETGFTDLGGGNLSPTNPSSCKISAWWDYADDENYAKVNNQFEAYRLTRTYVPSGPADPFDYGQSVITTKNRLTGRGRALSLRFETTDNNDCRLLGWGLGLESNTRV